MELRHHWTIAVGFAAATASVLVGSLLMHLSTYGGSPQGFFALRFFGPALQVAAVCGVVAAVWLAVLGRRFERRGELLRSIHAGGAFVVGALAAFPMLFAQAFGMEGWSWGEYASFMIMAITIFTMPWVLIMQGAISFGIRQLKRRRAMGGDGRG